MEENNPQPESANPAHPDPTHTGSSGGWYKATLPRRFWASLIDAVIIGLIQVILMLFLPKNEGQSLGWILGTIYSVGFIWQKGATPGKMAMKITVLRTDGAKLTFWQALLRESVGKLLSGLALGLGYLWAFWDQNRQTWHDKIAGTYVVTKVPNDGKKSGCLFALVIAAIAVIPAIAILAAVVVLIINPLELTRRSRDAQRITDAANIQQALNVSIQSASEESPFLLCPTEGYCTGNSDVDFGSPDGKGWIKADLSKSKAVAMPNLPMDPVNDSTYHYTYCSDGKDWEINFPLESEQQKSKMETDNGDYSRAYELGSNLTICKDTSLTRPQSPPNLDQ